MNPDQLRKTLIVQGSQQKEQTVLHQRYPKLKNVVFCNPEASTTRPQKQTESKQTTDNPTPNTKHDANIQTKGSHS